MHKKNNWRQDFYEVKNPEKYKGDVKNVFYRSSWEFEAFKFCDNNPNVIEWASEEIVIPYAMPTSSGGIRPAKYYPDLYMKYVNSAGKICTELIEIKPKKETRPSRSRNPKTKMMENATYQKNMLKWEAARNWCKQKGMIFRVITEQDQFN